MEKGSLVLGQRWEGNRGAETDFTCDGQLRYMLLICQLDTLGSVPRICGICGSPVLQHPLPCYFSFYCSLAATGNGWAFAFAFDSYPTSNSVWFKSQAFTF